MKLSRFAARLFSVSIVSLAFACESNKNKGVSAVKNIPEVGQASHLFLSNADMFGGLADIHNQIIQGVQTYEPQTKIHILAGDKVFKSVKNLYSKNDSQNVQVHRVSQTFNWARDFLPELVVGSGKPRNLLRFSYERNDFAKADSVAQENAAIVSEILNLKLIESSISLEGGNLVFADSNKLITSERIINENRSLSEESLAQKIQDDFSLTGLRILPQMPNESTGHVDMYLKFLGNSTFLISRSEDPERSVFLSKVTDRFEKDGYKIVRIDEASFDYQGIVASYTNSTVIGNTVLLPQFSDEYSSEEVVSADKNAVRVYKDLGFNVVPIKGMGNLLPAGGSVHCITKEYRVR